jgi:sulfur-oxidizing protein SoxX
MKSSILSLVVIAALFSSGCSQEQIANRGFSLPEGDMSKGQLLLTQFRCFECHTMTGTDYPADEWRLTQDGGIAVELGGVSTRVQTYGDLVTSVINPSHRIANGYSPEEVMDEDGNSNMKYYNNVMTVEELVDIVTFLKTKYEFKSYNETVYPYYIYP